MPINQQDLFFENNNQKIQSIKLNFVSIHLSKKLFKLSRNRKFHVKKYFIKWVIKDKLNNIWLKRKMNNKKKNISLKLKINWYLKINKLKN